MRTMIEIEWLDGRMTKVPELVLGDAFGESVQAELDFGFDDVSEGLWVEVRHHEPDEARAATAREGLRAVRGLPVQPGRTVGPRARLLHPLRGAAEGLPRRGGARGPRVGGERGRCVGIRDGGGFRNACGGENPVGRGLFVMLLALSFERLRLALQRQNPQMLKQDLKPDEDEHDAAHDGAGFS